MTLLRIICGAGRGMGKIQYERLVQAPETVLAEFFRILDEPTVDTLQTCRGKEGLSSCLVLLRGNEGLAQLVEAWPTVPRPANGLSLRR